MRLAQRGDRAFVKIRGGTRLTRTLTRPTQSGPALAVGRNNALPHQRSCRVRGSSLPLPRFGFAASRFSALPRLPHSRCSQDDSLHRSRRVFARRHSSRLQPPVATDVGPPTHPLDVDGLSWHPASMCTMATLSPICSRCPLSLPGRQRHNLGLHSPRAQWDRAGVC